MSLSILFTVVVLNVHFRSGNTHEMPVWTKSLFLYVLPRILLMKRPPIVSSITTSNHMRDYAQSFLSETQKANRSADANGKKKEDEQQLKCVDNLDPRLDKFSLIESTTAATMTAKNEKKNKKPTDRSMIRNQHKSRKETSQQAKHKQQQQQPKSSIRNRLLAAKKFRTASSSWSLGAKKTRPISQSEVEVLEDKLEAIGALNNIVSHLQEEHRENRVSQQLRETISILFEFFF